MDYLTFMLYASSGITYQFKSQSQHQPIRRHFPASLQPLVDDRDLSNKHCKSLCWIIQSWSDSPFPEAAGAARFGAAAFLAGFAFSAAAFGGRPRPFLAPFSSFGGSATTFSAFLGAFSGFSATGSLAW